MPGIDFGGLVLGLLTLLVQLVLLIIALVFGTTSLLRLLRPASAAGLKPAFIAIGICAAVGGWQVLFFTPWRFPNARPYLWMPFVPLAVAASAATLWLMRRWRPSGTLALMAVIATLSLTIRRRFPPAMGPPPRQSLLGESRGSARRQLSHSRRTLRAVRAAYPPRGTVRTMPEVIARVGTKRRETVPEICGRRCHTCEVLASTGRRLVRTGRAIAPRR